MKTIGNFISYEDSGKQLTIVISPREERWKEGLILMWLLSWSVVGAYFIYELLYGNNPDTTRVGLIVMVGFWAYFEVRIGRALIWKMFGKELIRITADKMTYKRDVKGYGKAKSFFLDNIKNFGIIKTNDRSFTAVMNNSFWLKGNETLGFDHMGTHVKMGFKLDESDRQKAGRLIQDSIRKYRKKKS